MRAVSGYIASAKLVARPEWQEPMRDGITKHRRFIWVKRGGTGGSGGSGPTGYKATPRRLLQRALAERDGANLATTARQALQRQHKINPPRVIQGLLGASA